MGAGVGGAAVGDKPGSATKNCSIRSVRDLRVYVAAQDAAMRIYSLSTAFPREELYSLTDQVRRSSRSVCANIAEGWQKRFYPAAFAAKMVDAAGEAAETRTWIEFAGLCGFLSEADVRELDGRYDRLVAGLVRMKTNAKTWRIA